MAVYTQVSAEALGAFLARYDHGELLSAKGIAEGVQNSNYLVETTADRFILTLHEERTSTEDLPFFLDMLDHLASDGNPVPRALPDRDGVAIQQLAGRSACLIEFLTGVSVSHPTAAQAYAAGAAMGHMHTSLAGFAQTRANPLGADTWQPFLARCGRAIDLDRAGAVRPDRGRAGIGAGAVAARPADSSDSFGSFPDNVLMLGDRVTGVIDFYFACTDIRAYDLAVMHTSWAFDGNGENYNAAIGKALIDGYAGQFALSDAERGALPILARGACLRFLLTRAWDWLNTPADALVTRKDPLAYWRRLEAYLKDDLFA
ncbi:homoserine kinase [Sphingomonas aurantiaca]|uniref:homoserine kinase n=1 Tax=Sphingomonas aurantiaca TaxID=185949 RepID=UPI002FDFDFFD